MKSYIAAALLAATAVACLGDDLSGPELGDADHRILFVGNSLTYTNDLPGVVQALADRLGLSVSHAVIAEPNVSLEDHWHMGIADEIRRLAPDIVVLQQGPSSTPENGAHLAQWTATIAEVVREAGGRPALYGVWPDYRRAGYFDEVRDHYRAAAESVDGAFVPAGWSWVEAWYRDADLGLYGIDGFHPSRLGTLVAAHTVIAVLFDVAPAEIPALDASVDEATLAVIREAVAASVDGWALR